MLRLIAKNPLETVTLQETAVVSSVTSLSGRAVKPGCGFEATALPAVLAGQARRSVWPPNSRLRLGDAEPKLWVMCGHEDARGSFEKVAASSRSTLKDVSALKSLWICRKVIASLPHQNADAIDLLSARKDQTLPQASSLTQPCQNRNPLKTPGHSLAVGDDLMLKGGRL